MTSSTVVTALLNWFEAHGGKNPKLEIRYLGELEGHGVYTKQALTRTETTIQVPFQLTMSIKSAAQSDLGPVFEKYHQIPDDEILALHLMHERTKGKNSFFAPFIASLPTTFDLPVFWTATELHELQGTNVVLLTQLMQKQLQHDFESIHQAVITDFPAIFRAFPTLTLHDYTWAMSVIWSRAFGITRKATYIRVLCPILDMFNHDSRVSDPLDDFVSFDTKRDMLRHHVPHNVVANSALTISYGLYSNAKLLYSYGFVTKENNHRVLDFWMKLPRNDPQWKRKQLLLDSNELTNNQTYDFRGTLFLKDVDERLLATLRVIVANEHEWNLLDKAFKESIVSIRNELAVYETLQTACRRKLATYATTLEEDHVLVLHAETEWNRRLSCAIQVRMEDKHVLTSVVNTLEQWKHTLVESPETYPPSTTRALELM